MGVSSSLKAKLWGIFLGLKLAISLGITKLIVEVDSQIAIYLLYKSTSLLHFGDSLVSQIGTMLKHFQQVKILHLFRKGNACANWLANWVVQPNNVVDNHVLDSPPIGLFPLLSWDHIGE